MASQQQVAALLKSLITKGLETSEALPTIKALVEAKIVSLDQLTADNMPATISKPIRAKLLKRGRKNSKQTGGGKSFTKKAKMEPIVIPPVSTESSQKETILINRSPILTLWASVVAQKLFSLKFEEALTVGSAYSAACARAKGTSLGIYSSDNNNKNEEDSREELNSATRTFHLMNQTVRAVQTPVGLRAIGNDEEEQDPHKIWKSLTKKLGDDLSFVLQQMKEAAEDALDELDATAYSYYVHIRPNIPQGTKGWGAHGHLMTSNLSNFYPIVKPSSN